MSDLQTFEDLADALRGGVEDSGPDRAAVDLLIETGVWLADRAFVADYVTLSEEEPGVAWVDWGGLDADLRSGDFVAVGTEGFILRFALSFANRGEVSLLDMVRLSVTEAGAVARAVATAAHADRHVLVTVADPVPEALNVLPELLADHQRVAADVFVADYPVGSQRPARVWAVGGRVIRELESDEWSPQLLDTLARAHATV